MLPMNRTTKDNPVRKGPKASAYYDGTGWEAIDVMEDIADRARTIGTKTAFCLAMAAKYILRAGIKPGEPWEKDIAKAENYLHRAVHGSWKEE